LVLGWLWRGQNFKLRIPKLGGNSNAPQVAEEAPYQQELKEMRAVEHTCSKPRALRAREGVELDAPRPVWKTHQQGVPCALSGVRS